MSDEERGRSKSLVELGSDKWKRMVGRWGMKFWRRGSESDRRDRIGFANTFIESSGPKI
jgi:hypothetical protein